MDNGEEHPEELSSLAEFLEKYSEPVSDALKKCRNTVVCGYFGYIILLFYGFLDAFFFRMYLFCVNFVAFFKFKKITTSKWVSPKRVSVKEKE